MKRIAISATVAAMLVAVAGCSSDGNSDASTASAVAGSPKPGSAEIARFDVPESVQCAGATFTSVSVEYQTSGAARAELRVDGRPIPLDDPARGSVSADVRCDPLPHDFVLLAYDDRDGLTFEERLLDTVG